MIAMDDLLNMICTEAFEGGDQMGCIDFASPEEAARVHREEEPSPRLASVPPAKEDAL